MSSLLPTAAVQNSTTGASNSFSSLTAADFVKMMVTQLQNQDPLNPTNSQDILAQMSEIGQLQSSSQLQTTLTGTALQNQIGAASALLGKSVQGNDLNNNAVSGTVTSITITQTPANQSPTGVATNTVTLNLDSGGSLPLQNVTSITPAPVTATTTTGATTTGATNTTGAAPSTATPS
jgi:flagellar basal-body rod modification protein FlgD